MYKDFKKSESLDTGFVGGSGIIWMFSGIILGLLVGLGMYYFTNNDYSPLSMASTVQEKIKKAQNNNPAAAKLDSTHTNGKSKLLYTSKQQKAKQEERTTKFSYYAVLPTLDVPVGSVRAINTNPNPKKIINGAKSAEDKAELVQVAVKEKIVGQEELVIQDGNFLLQVASYKKKSRANLTRGRLTKKGIDAYIKSKTIKGRMWYRVVAGPVDQQSVGSWKVAAEKMGHRPLVISLR